MKKKEYYIVGLKAGIPVILGFVPVGIGFAIMARQAGFTLAQTCASSLMVFAGAAQIMSTGMVAEGASLFAMILATFLLNLRHVIMSICVFTKIPVKSRFLRMLMGFGITDETFAIVTTTEDERVQTPFGFLGLATVSYLSWFAGTFLGAIASDFLPAMVSASLGVSLYAMFLGLLMPGLTKNLRLTMLVLFTAVCNTLLRLVMEPSWALIVSTLVCAFLGVFFVELEEEA